MAFAFAAFFLYNIYIYTRLYMGCNIYIYIYVYMYVYMMYNMNTPMRPEELWAADTGLSFYRTSNAPRTDLLPSPSTR